MDTQEPELNSIDVEFSSEQFNITADARTVRNCADCGTELKALDVYFEESVDFDVLSEGQAFKALTEEQQKALLAACEDGTADIHIEDTGTDYDESGGHRYKKNIIKSTVHYEITVKWQEKEFTYAGDLTSENAASEFEEQV